MGNSFPGGMLPCRRRGNTRNHPARTLCSPQQSPRARAMFASWNDLIISWLCVGLIAHASSPTVIKAYHDTHTSYPTNVDVYAHSPPCASATCHNQFPPSVISTAAQSQDNWRDNMMSLQLLEGGSWATVAPDGATPIKIMSIDTGAGVVDLPGGVQIAVVREDSTTALCEDSCSFADDGQCDEPGVVSVVWRHTLLVEEGHRAPSPLPFCLLVPVFAPASKVVARWFRLDVAPACCFRSKGAIASCFFCWCFGVVACCLVSSFLLSA